ncbi:dihydrofolate reductase family protein [Arthrobacter sp. ISL-30]|uniref:dihydrofolate reductase family protein n=1 Tax=Arthrobacter sp. ISL-30 TaxID=2819109 RepID=UPI001BE5D155|nr:dihydrofolate reductase family protein [Arthrobacter sp. ISL-30]MBT2515768.1 dihydrofolate reductase family protein [Arthrobacter sp. ISL-30]
MSRIYNRIQKAVVTDSYTPPDDNPWYDTTTVVPRGEVARWLAESQEGHSGDILIYGSRTMWNGLLQQGLVDELHLMVGPAALGGGTPIFSIPTDLALLETRRFKGSDNVLLRYSASRHR